MNFEYCPKCGTPKSVKSQDKTAYKCQKCGELFWNNPRGASAALFLKDDQALFAKRGIEPDLGMYELPGGFMDYCEDAYEACIREIKEETGLQVSTSDLELLTTYTGEYMPGVSSVDLVFVVKRWNGEPKADDDVAELEWKPVEFFNDGKFIRPYKNIVEKIRAYQSK